MTAAAAERDPRGARRGRRRFLRSLVADPLRKLLALALAVPLWIFLDSQVREPKEERLSLVAGNERNEDNAFGLRIDLTGNEQYRVKGFRDPVDDSELKYVELIFRGPKHVVTNILDAPDLFVRPRINPQTNVFVFDRSDIRSTDPNVAITLEEMKPRFVAVLLERMAQEPLVLSMARVQVEYPDTLRFPDFRARLRLDAAEFSERQVLVRGTRQNLDAALHDERPLFRLDLSGQGTATAPRITAPLVLLPTHALDIGDRVVSVTIPLDPKFEEYELRVPVLVDVICRPRTRLEDLEFEPAIHVKLRVSGELAGLLSTLPPGPERDAWAQEHTRFDVKIPADWTGDAQVFLGAVRLLETRFVPGRDFQGVDTQSVQVRLKKKE